MKNLEPTLNKLLDVFFCLIEDGDEALFIKDDEIREIVIDETFWPRLVGSLGKTMVIEPKKSYWRRGDKLIPICTVDMAIMGRGTYIMLHSKKGITLKWPILD